MRAILLAAGLGTRLRPLTKSIPKCLLSIKGKPLLEIILTQLKESHIGPFLINTHYLSKQIETYIQQSTFSNEVSIVHEPILLGTSGTLLANLDFFNNEDGLLVHADNYCIADFNSFINAHNKRPSNCLLTMMTFPTLDPNSCCIVELDENGVVIDFHEKVENQPGNIANGAIYILSKELISILKKDFQNTSDFSNEVLPKFLGKIYTYHTKDFFIDIGTLSNYKKANEY